MEALTILILCGAGLILLVAYMMYRIGAYRRKMSVVNSARTISTAGRDSPRAEKGSGIIDSPTIPEKEILVILHKGNTKPWLKPVNEKLSKGLRVVVVTLREPSRIRSRFRGDSYFIWLDRSTAHGRSGDLSIVNPTNLSKLLSEIEDNITKDGVVLFHGFEDLLSTNDASRVLRFLGMLEELCRKKDFSTVVPAPYKAVPQRIRVQLTEGFETVVI
jgi:hypothetical protein